MDEIEIQGGYPLRGEVKIQGSKNAVLPLLAACILYEGTTILEGVPDILDVHYMAALLKNLGCEVFFENHRLMVNAEELKKGNFPKEAAEKSAPPFFSWDRFLAEEMRERYRIRVAA